MNKEKILELMVEEGVYEKHDMENLTWKNQAESFARRIIALHEKEVARIKYGL